MTDYELDELIELRAEVAAQKDELAICRDAIEACYEFARDHFPSDDDGDAAVRRTSMRRLQEAVGKATPRLLMERPEGQRMYGLRWRELTAEVVALREDAERLQWLLSVDSVHLMTETHDLIWRCTMTSTNARTAIDAARATSQPAEG